MNKSFKKKDSKRYLNLLDLVDLSTHEEVHKKIREWIPGLNDNQHLVRSTILDIDANIEILLKQIFYHHLKMLVFQTSDEKENKKALKPFDKMIRKANFGLMYRILKPSFDSWPYPDLVNIKPIHDLRNQVAHSASIDKIDYKGRNPFKDTDAFAQVYFEAWAIKQELTRFFYKAVEGPMANCREYYKEYQRLLKEKQKDKS